MPLFEPHRYLGWTQRSPKSLSVISRMPSYFAVSQSKRIDSDVRRWPQNESMAANCCWIFEYLKMAGSNPFRQDWADTNTATPLSQVQICGSPMLGPNSSLDFWRSGSSGGWRDCRDGRKTRCWLSKLSLCISLPSLGSFYTESCSGPLVDFHSWCGNLCRSSFIITLN